MMNVAKAPNKDGKVIRIFVYLYVHDVCITFCWCSIMFVIYNYNNAEVR